MLASRKRLPILFLLLGGIIVVALAAFLIVNGLQHSTTGNPNSSSTNGGQTNGGPSTGGSNSGGGEQGGTGQVSVLKDPVYVSQITGQIAQGLHLSTDQIKTQLQGGKTMAEIATAQRISASQLQTIELNAFQSAFNNAVHASNMLQSTEDHVMQQFRTDPQFLDSKVVQVFTSSSGGH